MNFAQTSSWEQHLVPQVLGQNRRKGQHQTACQFLFQNACWRGEQENEGIKMTMRGIKSISSVAEEVRLNGGWGGGGGGSEAGS